jgi:hypothetical protein
MYINHDLYYFASIFKVEDVDTCWPVVTLKSDCKFHPIQQACEIGTFQAIEQVDEICIKTCTAPTTATTL